MLHQQTAQLSCMKLILVVGESIKNVFFVVFFFYVSLCSLGNVLKHLLER